jgi:hypothetical protein
VSSKGTSPVSLRFYYILDHKKEKMDKSTYFGRENTEFLIKRKEMWHFATLVPIIHDSITFMILYNFLIY